MANTMTDVYVKLIQMTVLLIIIILLAYKQKKFKINALFWLNAVFLFGFLQGVFELTFYVLKTNVDPAWGNYEYIAFFPHGLSILTLFFFSENLYQMRPSYIRTFIVSSIWAGSQLAMLYDMIYGLESSTYIGERTSIFIFNLFQLVAMIFVTYVFLQSYLKAKEPSTKRGALLMTIGVAIYVIGEFHELLEYLFGIPNYNVSYFIVITLLLLAYQYFTHPYFVFAVPTTIYRLILSDTNGMYIYGAEIESELREEMSDELIASAMTATKRFIEETAGTASYVRYVDLGERSILSVQVRDVIGLLIVERASYLLKSALNKFVEEFHEAYQDKVDAFLGDLTIYEGAEEIVARCFPFLESKDIISLYQTKGI